MRWTTAYYYYCYYYHYYFYYYFYYYYYDYENYNEMSPGPRQLSCPPPGSIMVTGSVGRGTNEFSAANLPSRKMMVGTGTPFLLPRTP